MSRWVFVLFTLVSSGAVAACGSQSTAVTGPTSAATMTGNWVGTAADSSGSMMGSGMSGATAGSTTWQVVAQNGSAFSGTMHLPGDGGNAIVVSGAMNGKTGTFTMTMTVGSMSSMMSGSCTSTATGTFDMDDMMTQFHGTYAGTNTCAGPFNGGQMSMLRQ